MNLDADHWLRLKQLRGLLYIAVEDDQTLDAIRERVVELDKLIQDVEARP